VIRRGGHLDVPFMRSMLTHAYNWHVNVFDTEIPLSRYVDGWGRAGDTALIAMEAGHRVGAAWYRLFRASAPGYGFVDEDTPELTVAVVPGRRGEGIGHELLRGLAERARADGYRALSASIERQRPDEVGIFEQEGFEPVRESEHALVLRRNLGTDSQETLR
jgi:L-amino acid N-acyltransferase YncA